MTNGESLALRLDPNDNVAIARHAIPRGSVLSEYPGMPNRHAGSPRQLRRRRLERSRAKQRAEREMRGN